ncbi:MULTISPECIES: DUF7716 domain-containing protein [Caulobacter]|jgi:hypothetical protein|uniref:DUF7716 domain-containing protein n=1 Tax=Caulobacter rhizosphaerae TaxID=2010972 RepID=A0ABU1MW68_9CAUL|nr:MULTISPECIES: hypothetical protein [Caulobacter]MDR6529936.1 hypothetical protein [Caulobacter rhizosphaerae]GGL28469.1 hypothetical protein GCM10010983_27360 [Caulobacter rhizosphaerae]
MTDNTIVAFQDMLAEIMAKPHNAWVYLPSTKNWNLESKSAALESEEVPPELEDEPDAGVPQFAKDEGLMQVMPVATLQDIVSNAREQKRSASLMDLFAAFEFYYERDAFIEFQD